MTSCPLPEGYDARRVRPSLEAAFKELGYSGPVSITAYGDHNHTPLQALSSTGVHALHCVPGSSFEFDFFFFLAFKISTPANTEMHSFYCLIDEDTDLPDMASVVEKWHYDNPPRNATIMMVISDHVDWISHYLVELLQENNYKLFLAYSFRPSKTSFLLTSAEWLWESLLADFEQRRLVLHKCSSESGEPTATFNCSLCHFGTKSIDQFRKHLSTDKEHAKEVSTLSVSSLYINVI